MLDSILDDVNWVLQKLVANVEGSDGPNASNDNAGKTANKRRGERSTVVLRVSPRKWCVHHIYYLLHKYLELTTLYSHQV
jgi:hypothetical protein